MAQFSQFPNRIIFIWEQDIEIPSEISDDEMDISLWDKNLFVSVFFFLNKKRWKYW